MIKIYSMPTCPYCTYVEEQVKNDDNYVIIDIGSHVKYMHEFLELRDHNVAFKQAIAEGDIGLPCFVKEDGSVTLEPSDLGLHSYSEVLNKKVCRIGSKNC